MYMRIDFGGKVNKSINTKLFVQTQARDEATEFRPDEVTGYVNTPGVPDAIGGVTLAGTVYSIYEWAEYRREYAVAALNKWEAAFTGAVTSYKRYYGKTPGVRVSTGSIRVRGDSTSEAYGCWVAAHNKEVIQFELRLRDGRVFGMRSAAPLVVDNTSPHQLMSVGKPDLTEVFESVFSVPAAHISSATIQLAPNVSETTKKIIDMLCQGYKNKEIVEALGTSQQQISRVKRTYNL